MLADSRQLVQSMVPKRTPTSLAALSQARVKPGTPLSQAVVIYLYLPTAVTGQEVTDEMQVEEVKAQKCHEGSSEYSQEAVESTCSVQYHV